MTRTGVISGRPSPLSKAALWLLQSAVTAYAVVNSNLGRARNALQRLLPQYFRVERSIEAQRGKRPTFPDIAAIVLSETLGSHTCLDEVASVLWWCSELGLATVLVFEPKGELRKAAGILGQRLNFAKGSTFQVQAGFGRPSTGNSLAERRGLDKHGQESPTSSSPGDTSPHTRVILLSCYDAEAPLMAAAYVQPGAESQAKEDNPKRMRTTEDLFARIASTSGQSAAQEPNFIMVFGPVLTLAGFPPWLARNSEIYHAGRLAAVHREVIIDCIQRYCKTSQRFGA